LEFFPLAGNPKTWHNSSEQGAYLNSGRDGVRYVRQGISTVFMPIMEEQLRDCWNACQGTDAIIGMPLIVGGYYIADKLGVPYILSPTYPVTRTRAFPCPLLQTKLRLGGWYNWLTYVVVEQAVWQALRRPLMEWRQRFLGLPPLTWADYRRYLKVPVLYGFSPTIVPKPQDWPDTVHVTGYWFLDQPTDWQPSARLVKFLAAGAPPIYISFGSLVGENPVAMTQLLLQAIAQSGQRAILEMGWGGISADTFPDTVFNMTDAESAPHEWLLPRMAAAIHHGGAGTAAAVFRAGIPSLVIPANSDHYHWGQRIVDLQIGLPVIPPNQVTADGLAKAMQTLTRDRALQANATRIAQEIHAENGVAQAVQMIQHALNNSQITNGEEQLAIAARS
jgi:UDP:flavonoid glycosyltransferase YjiC (YdhE family)